MEMITSPIYVACMFRINSTSTLYFLHGNRMLDDPIIELKRLFPEENYISGFLLDNERYQDIIQKHVNEWKKFD